MQETRQVASRVDERSDPREMARLNALEAIETIDDATVDLFKSIPALREVLFSYYFGNSEMTWKTWRNLDIDAESSPAKDVPMTLADALKDQALEPKAREAVIAFHDSQDRITVHEQITIYRADDTALSVQSVTRLHRRSGAVEDACGDEAALVFQARRTEAWRRLFGPSLNAIWGHAPEPADNPLAWDAEDLVLRFDGPDVDQARYVTMTNSEWASISA